MNLRAFAPAIVLLLCFSRPGPGFAQAAADTKADSIQKATEFSIPSSGAFTLLGGKSAEVSTPGFTKDIKLDYFLDKFSLNPNIAFDFQPVWLFGMKRSTLSSYQSLPAIARFLSTANVSLGTRTAGDSTHRLATSLNFTIQHDPLMDKKYRHQIDSALEAHNDSRMAEEIKLGSTLRKAQNALRLHQGQRDTAQPGEEQHRLDSLITADNTLIVSTTAALTTHNADDTKALQKILKEVADRYTEQNWVRPKADVGAGIVSTYRNADVRKAGLRQQGLGLWLNPSFGFNAARIFNKNADAGANKVLISLLGKYIKTDSLDQQFLGGNIRYGSARLNLFVEYIYQKDADVKTQTIAYGGSYRIGNNKLLEFGIRTNYSQDFKFDSLTPTISVNWKLAADYLQ